MIITYCGHAVVMIEDENFKCIIDPYITGNPMAPCHANDIRGLTHIFITHGHSDHLGDCVELAKNNNAVVISNAEISKYLQKKGVKVHSMHIGGRHEFDFGTVKLTVALHGSSIEENGEVICGGNPCGFIIEVSGKKIYHAGDTGLTLDMKLLEEEHIDLAFLPIGGNYTMDIKDAIKALEFIKPKLVVPIHYDTFELIKADPHEFMNLNKTCETVILKSDDNISL